MVKMIERVGVTIKNFPAPLKGALMDGAEAAGVTLNDFAVAKLAESFGITFEHVGRAPREPRASRDVYLMMPVKLHQKIKHRATDKRVWPRELMIEVLEASLVA